jgi:hypothetical protein
MRKTPFIVVLFICIITAPAPLLSQENGDSSEVDPIVSSYLRNFARASLQTKIQILKDAKDVEGANMGPLYEKALDFVLDNQDLLATDPMIRQLSVLSTQLIGISQYAPARYKIWDLFEIDTGTTVRVAVLNSLGEIAEGDERLIEQINAWLSRQNSLFQANRQPDLQVIGECVTTLGKIGSENSFPIVFTTMTLNYSEEVTNKAREALKTMEGDFQEMLIRVVEKNPASEKLAALRMALDSGDLSEDEKGLIAEKALEMGVTTNPASIEKESMRELRYVAVNTLTARKWSKATPLVIKHFNEIVVEYDRGLVSKTNFLEAIACLGAMGTHEAAERLNLYLGLLNQYKENERPVDEQVVLAVVRNLGILGDRIAADNLLYTQYLNFSSTVRKAAKEAFNNLKRS